MLHHCFSFTVYILTLFYIYSQDIKMKKMADLQLTVVSDPRSKQAIEKQIAQWDENLEKLYIEQFRLRCYMSSLQGCELPNPKVRNMLCLETLGRRFAGVYTWSYLASRIASFTKCSTCQKKRKKKNLFLFSHLGIKVFVFLSI